MKTRPVVPGSLPATASDAHGFLDASALPCRWARRPRFVVLALGFGAGHAFLAAWQAWRDDADRCDRLFFVALDAHPLTKADLARAHAGSSVPALANALVDEWPALTPNLHPIDFDGGHVRLLLGWGEWRALLPELRLQADAIHVPGSLLAQDPSLTDRYFHRALSRAAAPGASIVSGCVEAPFRDGLSAAGFQLAPLSDAPALTTGRHAPRAASVCDDAPALREAVVVGAGLAGASVAASLASLGWSVHVIDRHAAPAAETSGNPAGLFHGTLHPDDGPHARLFRAAALTAARDLRPASAGPGLLRLDHGPLSAMQALIDRQRLPPDYVQALDAGAASALAGVPLGSPAWWFPQGGWLSPPALVQAWLRTPNVRFTGGVDVASLHAQRGGWALRSATGESVAQAPTVVLANAGDAARLLAPMGHAPWPLQHSRGQVSGWHGATTPLCCAVAGDGYALPLPGGGVLCGATASLDDDAAALRDADHHHNFERLSRLTGLQPPADPSAWFGRVGWRLQADDRLPLVGPVPLPDDQIAAGARLDQVRWVPRVAGLHVLTGLGSRGITLAPLMGRLLAARIEGAPWPLERDLADAVDPARWRVRRARREQG